MRSLSQLARVRSSSTPHLPPAPAERGLPAEQEVSDDAYGPDVALGVVGALDDLGGDGVGGADGVVLDFAVLEVLA